MTKFFNKLKKPYYWPILIPFPNFFFLGGGGYLPENLAMSCATSYGHVHLIIAVVCLHLTSIPPTTRDCLGLP